MKTESWTETVERLARMPEHAYDLVRERHADEHGVRITTLDNAVRKQRKQLAKESGDDMQGRNISLPEPKPWPEPVSGDDLLSSISAAIRKHVVLSKHAADAAALWCVHSHLLDCFVISPRLAIKSPMKRCGKTTLLDVISLLVSRRPRFA
jgi:hypothetical protein